MMVIKLGTNNRGTWACGGLCLALSITIIFLNLSCGEQKPPGVSEPHDERSDQQAPKSVVTQVDAHGPAKEQSQFLADLQKDTYDQTAAPVQAPVFRWKFSKKDIHTYVYEQKVLTETDMGTVFADSSGDEKPSISAKQLVKGTILVKSQGDGTATLVLQDVKASMEMHPDRDRGPKTMEQTMPPLVVQDMKEDGSASFGDSSRDMLLRMLFPLPPKTLNVGEAVDVPAQMPFNAMGSRLYVKGRLRITLARYVKISDRTCAQFEVDIDISELKVPSELEGEYKCLTKGASVFYFDVSSRRFVSGTTAVWIGFSVDALGPKIKTPGVEVPEMPKRHEMAMVSDNLIRVALRD